MPYIKTKALIIGKKLHKEHDKNLLLLLEDGRKIEAKIRKARDTSAKWGAITEPVSYVEVDVYDRAGRYTVTGIDIVKYFGQSSYKLMVAQDFICEVLDRTTPYTQAEEELFEVALKAFDALEKFDLGTTIAWFLLEILRINGYPLHVETCVACGAEILNDACFDVATGSAVCRCCKTANSINFPYAAVQAVRNLGCEGCTADIPQKMALGLIKLELRILMARFETNLATSLHVLSLC
ncbi:MAG: DNA repair protein RecO [Caldiserica bacterium]|nr:DNA repair protein RecO [Caldisericota bacterium]